MTDHLPDADRIIQQLRNDGNDAAAELIEALREQCELMRETLEFIKQIGDGRSHSLARDCLDNSASGQ